MKMSLVETSGSHMRRESFVSTEKTVDDLKREFADLKNRPLLEKIEFLSDSVLIDGKWNEFYSIEKRASVSTENKLAVSWWSRFMLFELVVDLPLFEKWRISRAFLRKYGFRSERRRALSFLLKAKWIEWQRSMRLAEFKQLERFGSLFNSDEIMIFRETARRYSKG